VGSGLPLLQIKAVPTQSINQSIAVGKEHIGDEEKHSLWALCFLSSPNHASLGLFWHSVLWKPALRTMYYHGMLLNMP
jgi:hypothetical protein